MRGTSASAEKTGVRSTRRRERKNCSERACARQKQELHDGAKKKLRCGVKRAALLGKLNTNSNGVNNGVNKGKMLQSVHGKAAAQLKFDEHGD